MEDLEFKIIKHNSNEYQEFLKIRYDILRKPLGLNYTKEQLAEEDSHIHIIALINQVIIGGLLLVNEENCKIKMRQVAISTQFQSRGIGQALIQFAENYAKNNGYNYMHCHARKEASEFYKKLNYNIKGEEFQEVGIPHYYMFKNLI